MKLKVTLSDEEFAKLDASLQPLYEKAADGRYHLDMEEDPAAKSKIEEFRNNNIKLMKEKDELQKKLESYGGNDPEKIREMQARIQQIEDKKLIEAGKLDELVTQKTERMRQDYENQITQLKSALDAKDKELGTQHNRLSEVLIDSEITKAVTAIGGVRKGAMEDIIARGRRVWKLEEGKPVPKDGDKILYGKDGKDAMTFDEWAKVLSETATFLFETNTGSGGTGGATGVRKSELEQMKGLPPGERLKQLHGAGSQS